MSKFAQYNIPLKDMTGVNVLEYDLDDAYFKKIDSPEVQKGLVKASVRVEEKSGAFELQFLLDGYVNIPCDRCLSDMEQPIHCKDQLKVKLGDRFSEENEIVIVPESEGTINVAWFLYEFIVLSIPVRHVHVPGGCNKTMTSKLKKHMVRQSDEDGGSDLEYDDDDYVADEIPTDSGWDGLQNISDNN
ncbi:MAG: DUF177 domain-containing protein [Prevotellaceae bacterium]|jgi:uncharacterized metal-binding protein YceD (DUF177 family)|nr:DUF177 domain-containing protein [Prevotellaceae bacterium]